MDNFSSISRRSFFKQSLAGFGALTLTSCASSWYGSRLAAGDVGDVNDMIGRWVSPFLLHDANPSSPTFDGYVGPQQYGNRVVLLTFGASWSASTLEQLSQLKKVQEEYDSSLMCMVANGNNGDWRLVDISGYPFPVLDRKGKTTHSLYLVEEGGYTWYVKGEIVDNLGPAFAQYVFGVKTFPTTFVIDEHQKVREVHQLLLSAETLSSIVALYSG